MDSQPIFKRVKERSVWEAKASVDHWRKLFKEGITDQVGKNTKLTLKQAAEYVGIPKKTLEDYHQLLRKVSQITPLETLQERKMGFLRQFLKENKSKTFEQPEDIDEEEEEEEEDVEFVQSFTYDEQEQIQQQQQAQPEPISMTEENHDWEHMIVEGPTAPYILWDDDIWESRVHEDRINIEYPRHTWAEDQVQMRAPIVNFMFFECIYDPTINLKEEKDILLSEDDIYMGETEEED